MKDGYTHIGLILDASGSMSRIENDIKGSLRAFARDQLAAKTPDETILLDAWQFDDVVKHIIHCGALTTYKPDLYQCGGCTALYDAICVGVDELGRQFAALPESERPEDVLVVIVTDGYENASKKFKLADVRKRIETQSKVYSWKFLFLASNIDVDAVGQDMGIADAADRAALSNEDFADDMRHRMNSAQSAVRQARMARRKNQ